MDEFISRKATIDAVETIGFDFSDSDLSAVELEEVCEAIGEVRQEWLQRIKRLSSAQPEIVRCKDCKHWSRESICDGFCSEDCMRHDEDFYCGYAERKTNE